MVQMYIRDEVFLDQQRDMSSLYFGQDVFYQFKARVPELDPVSSVVQCTLYKGGGGA